MFVNALHFLDVGTYYWMIFGVVDRFVQKYMILKLVITKYFSATFAEKDKVLERDLFGLKAKCH